MHPDLANDLWCHHWTARPPRLPVMEPQQSAGQPQPRPNRQLSLEAVLPRL
jgi:hypothetical protein